MKLPFCCMLMAIKGTASLGQHPLCQGLLVAAWLEAWESLHACLYRVLAPNTIYAFKAQHYRCNQAMHVIILGYPAGARRCMVCTCCISMNAPSARTCTGHRRLAQTSSSNIAELGWMQVLQGGCLSLCDSTGRQCIHECEFPMSRDGSQGVFRLGPEPCNSNKRARF